MAPLNKALTIAGVVLVLAGAFAYGARATRYRPEAMRADNAVGDATCISCHQDKASFERTAHRLTSRLPSREAMAGDFAAHNVLRTSNPMLYFRMAATDTGFYQTAVFGRHPDTTVRSERIDIVTGSGRRGQSFLSWRGDRLYQLPVSHWAILGWANSPAYPDGQANFDRPIPPRCLECHAAGVEPIEDARAVNRYNRTGMMLGVMCETCHASGKEHVSRERSVLRAILPPAIVNPSRLARNQQVDGCALCHGGAVPLESAPFSHVPGQPVRPAQDLWQTINAGAGLDVHGNQVALLQRSRCFAQSEMSCATCHDVHQEQRDPAALSGRCMTCHTVRSCNLFPQFGETLRGQCVDCHMPSLPSMTAIANTTRGAPAHQYVRSHWIKIYRQFAALPVQKADSAATAAAHELAAEQPD